MWHRCGLATSSVSMRSLYRSRQGGCLFTVWVIFFMSKRFKPSETSSVEPISTIKSMYGSHLNLGGNQDTVSQLTTNNDAKSFEIVQISSYEWVSQQIRCQECGGITRLLVERPHQSTTNGSWQPFSVVHAPIGPSPVTGLSLKDAKIVWKTTVCSWLLENYCIFISKKLAIVAIHALARKHGRGYRWPIFLLRCCEHILNWY
jgi:hypothetical protein